MNYLVIDLEMCRVSKLYKRNYKYVSEIIQIGAVLLDENFERIATLCQYVAPEYGVLDGFIERMTGIHDCDIKNAPKLQESMEHLVDWIGDREYKVYAWSDSDCKQLQHEIKSKGIVSDKMEDFMKADRWIDYQAVFSERFRWDRQYSLKEALECAEVEPEGKFHDGLDDTINTGNMIKKLERDKDFEIVSYRYQSTEEHLNWTIGDMFGDLLVNVR